MVNVIVYLYDTFLILIFSAGPSIISRWEWNVRARPPKFEAPNLKIRPAPYVLIHHSAGSSCNTQESCKFEVEQLQNKHMDTKGWSDIAYNFLVGEDGNIYEGRGWDKQGAHSVPFNKKSIGICIIGNYNTRTPNAAAIRAVAYLIFQGVENGKIKSDYKLLGHRQTWPTMCPGDSLYTMIKSWPHWSDRE
ncbi:peptidoglycan-recognition protein SC2-like [Pogonomyrmex barbatus]|uniref:Peptidoglycan-recognition protein n=1 Tax=Pogonomyrmex barbatus TaxID=144034 RepID=A0A8N1S8B6_9HYME|nr:peptidoglycan-recognition protein SC2-like [Pogonomyrmex barbatus]